jgi:hypothetical protein
MTDIRETTRQIGDAIRTLLGLTCGPADELRHPADVRDIASGLRQAISRMPELFGQLAAFLEVENVRGTIASQGGTGVTAAVREVSEALHRAGLDAEAMTAALEAAVASCERVAERSQEPGDEKARAASRGRGNLPG